jgi:hypothetical protein
MIVTAALFLAQASPAAPTSGDINAAAVWIGGLCAVAVIANQIMSAMINVRKLRGVDPDSDARHEARYASKTVVDELAKDVASVRTEVAVVSNTLSNELRAIHRSLGRIEGRLGTDPGK